MDDVDAAVRYENDRAAYHVPATPQVPCWFVDENSLGVAKAHAYVRGDVTWPGTTRRPGTCGGR